MPRGNCVGVARVDRVRQDGSRVSGHRAWMELSGVEALEGNAYTELWVSDAWPRPQVGSMYLWSYNKWGRVDDFEEI